MKVELIKTIHKYLKGYISNIKESHLLNFLYKKKEILANICTYLQFRNIKYLKLF